jgi:phosphoglucosamine mutase
VIQLHRATTGDGLLAALELMSLVVRRQRGVRELRQVWRPVPRVAIDVPVPSRRLLDGSTDIRRAVDRERDALTGQGRLIVRMSTIEPVVRVICEAPTVPDATAVGERVAAVIRAASRPHQSVP